MNWFNILNGITTLTSIIIVILLIFILNMANKMPDIINDKIKSKYEFKNNHNLQIESYFRKIGNEQLQKVFDEWTKLITDFDYMKNQTPEKFKKLQQETIMYASSKTIKIIANVQQYEYTHYSENKERNNVNPIMVMVYIAMIVASLKQDFTGYSIDPLDILKIRLSDFSEHEDEYKEALNNIKKELV